MSQVAGGEEIAYGMGGIIMEERVGAWLFEEEAYFWN